jgi:hypothetical protein
MVMREYNLPHVLKSEQQHFALMSSLLDPMERAHIVRMGMGPGSRCGSRLLRRIVNPLVPGKIAIALTTPQHPSRGRFVGNTEMIGKLKNWHVGNAAG